MEEKIRYNQVPNFLSERIPEFKKVMNEHRKDNFGEILLHPLFGDLTRFTIEHFEKGIIKNNETSLSIFRKISDVIEYLLEYGDEKTDNLVYVSFLENITDLEKKHKDLKNHLGKKAQKGIRQIEEWE